MIAILFNLAEQPPSLIAGYEDFVRECAIAANYGSDESQYTTEEIRWLDESVQEAYRYIQRASLWSWKRSTTTLTTVASDNDYTLPADVGSVQGDITYAANEGFTHIKRTSPLDIRKRLQQSSQTAQPWLYTVRWRAQTSGSNQRQEMLLYPTPDDAYVLTYEYAVIIGKLSATNPYPLGGPAISQLMIEMCRAVGEAKKNGGRGPQWDLADMAMAVAIGEDNSTLTERTVGMMGDPDGRYMDYSIRSTSGSTYAGVG